MKEIQKEAKEALSKRTEEREEKILDLVKNEVDHKKELQVRNIVDLKDGIKCSEVEKMLDVSNTTARKYLNELESEEKIEQVSTNGKGCAV